MTVITAFDGMESANAVDQLLNALSGAGMRRTMAARAVAQVLVQYDCLTAAEVQARLQARDVRMDLTTVHRVLRRLADAGAVVPIPRDSSVGYRIASRSQHCLVCQSCGRVAPLTGPAAAALLAELSAAGFAAGPVTVATRCPRCH
ncbi:transcriptional repressor [Actinoplanes sp. NPDC026670]|uniref:Fur family transcriptional regulator n=1 Tax=Actinoplanes sp. NPDC026670 TaxID=3154700 RepID=UPI0033F1B998